jgi:hypothetical protein
VHEHLTQRPVVEVAREEWLEPSTSGASACEAEMRACASVLLRDARV